VEKIIMDSNLTEQQRIEAIKKIAED